MPKISEPRTKWQDRTPQDQRNRTIQRILLLCVFGGFSFYVIKRYAHLVEIGLVGVICVLVIVLIAWMFPTKW